jgi:hypothetical protein
LRLTDALPDRIALLERGPLRPGLDITRYDAGESPGVLTHTTLEDAWQRIPMVAMLVLEAPERGGELGFPSLSRTIDAQRGRVIVFRGDLPHELGVVQRGRQTVLHARFDFDASFDR